MNRKRKRELTIAKNTIGIGNIKTTNSLIETSSEILERYTMTKRGVRMINVGM